MIRYALVCDQHHDFESWFANSAAYDKQARQGLVTCPACGSAKIEKALMTPRLSRSHSASRQESGHGSHHESQDVPQQEKPQQQPAAAAADAAPTPAPVAMMTPQEHELRRKLRELRDHLVKNAEDVGSRFPEEARKMHYGEIEHRSIYGVASAQDAEALDEEGITFSALPVLPDDRN
jgi:hypothetical protein